MKYIIKIKNSNCCIDYDFENYSRNDFCSLEEMNRISNNKHSEGGNIVSHDVKTRVERNDLYLKIDRFYGLSFNYNHGIEMSQKELDEYNKLLDEINELIDNQNDDMIEVVRES